MCHAKFGQAGPVVQLFTLFDALPESLRLPTRVLTDLSGPFGTVVVEQIVASIDDYQRRLREMFADQEGLAAMGALAELFASGHREYYTSEAER